MIHVGDLLITDTGNIVLRNLATVNVHRLESFLLNKSTTASSGKTPVAVLNALMLTKCAHVSTCLEVFLFRTAVRPIVNLRHGEEIVCRVLLRSFKT